MVGSTDEEGLEILLALDGASYQAADGYRVEFKAERTDATPERPHGISYALVFRTDSGPPLVRFDNAHAVARPGGRFVKAARTHDHWHRTATDKGRPYAFVSPAQLLDDFWREVKRTLDEKGISHDL